MVDELRAEAPPELRWDEIERKLMLEVSKRERARIGRSGTVIDSAFGRIFAFAAAAAMLALGVTSMTGSHGEPRAAAVASRVVDLSAAPASADGERDLLSLREGDIIEATSAPVRFGHEGALAWTLEPGGRVQVRAMGKAGVGHVVALERGSIRAEVTPRDASEGMVEAFAVEVDQTRVAVHGTAFSVRREGDQVLVDVEHGSVAVGPRGNAGITTGHLLVGPRRASFSLDGGRSARLLDRAPMAGDAPASGQVAALAPVAQPAQLHAPAPTLAAPAADLRTAPAGHLAALEPAHLAAPEVPAPPAPPPVAAPAPLPTLTVAGVQSQLDQCFNRVYSGGSTSVKVSVSADVSLVLEADGRVQAVRFNPPLEPAFQQCAVAFFGRSFPEGGKTVKIPISFHK
jgi:hypothetical protein